MSTKEVYDRKQQLYDKLLSSLSRRELSVPGDSPRTPSRLSSQESLWRRGIRGSTIASSFEESSVASSVDGREAMSTLITPRLGQSNGDVVSEVLASDSSRQHCDKASSEPFFASSVPEISHIFVELALRRLTPLTFNLGIDHLEILSQALQDQDDVMPISRSISKVICSEHGPAELQLLRKGSACVESSYVSGLHQLKMRTDEELIEMTLQLFPTLGLVDRESCMREFLALKELACLHEFQVNLALLLKRLSVQQLDPLKTMSIFDLIDFMVDTRIHLYAFQRACFDLFMHLDRMKAPQKGLCHIAVFAVLACFAVGCSVNTFFDLISPSEHRIEAPVYMEGTTSTISLKQCKLDLSSDAAIVMDVRTQHTFCIRKVQYIIDDPDLSTVFPVRDSHFVDDPHHMVPLVDVVTKRLFDVVIVDRPHTTSQKLIYGPNTYRVYADLETGLSVLQMILKTVYHVDASVASSVSNRTIKAREPQFYMQGRPSYCFKSGQFLVFDMKTTERKPYILTAVPTMFHGSCFSNCCAKDMLLMDSSNINVYTPVGGSFVKDQYGRFYRYSPLPPPKDAPLYTHVVGMEKHVNQLGSGIKDKDDFLHTAALSSQLGYKINKEKLTQQNQKTIKSLVNLQTRNILPESFYIVERKSQQIYMAQPLVCQSPYFDADEELKALKIVNRSLDGQEGSSHSSFSRKSDTSSSPRQPCNLTVCLKSSDMLRSFPHYNSGPETYRIPSIIVSNYSRRSSEQ